MWPYLLTFISSLYLIYHSDRSFYLGSKRKALLLLVLSILIPSILAGCRDLDIGLDVELYVNPYFMWATVFDSFFQYLAFIESDFLYLFLNYVVSRFTNHIGWMLFFIQLVDITLVSLSLLRFRKYFPMWIGMAIYLGVFYNMSLNMVRQSMAMAFCLYSFSFMMEGSYKKSLLAFLPALGFHSTAFIYLAVYPLAYFFQSARKKKTIRWLECVGIAIAALSVYFWDNLLFSIVSIGMVTEKYAMYTSSNGVWGTNIPISDLMFSCFLFVMTLYVGYKTKSRLKKYFYIEFLFFVCIILCFTGIKSTFAVRAMYYISFLSIIAYPLVIQFYLQGSKSRKVILAISMLFLLFYWYMAYVFANFGSTYPYSSKILDNII